MRLHHVSKKSLLLLALSITSIVLVLFYLNHGQFIAPSQISNPKLLQSLSQGLNRQSSAHSRRLKGSLRLLPQGQEEGPDPEEYGGGDNEERGDDEGDNGGGRDDDEEDGGYDDDNNDEYDNDDSSNEEDNSNDEDSEETDESSAELTDGLEGSDGVDNSGSSDNDSEEHAHYPEDVEGTEEIIETVTGTPVDSEEVVVIIPHNSTSEGCSGSTPYAFLNGTCAEKCPTAAGYLIQINTSSGTLQLFCTPCDSSCASCANTTSTCTSCASGFPYLYTNHSCLATCPEVTHIIKELSDGKKACIPRDALNVTVTSTPTRLTVEQQRTARAVSNYTVIGGTLASIGLACSQLKNSGASGNLALMLLLNQIDYIKYFDINYSPLLMEVFNNQVNNLISFDFQLNFPYGDDGDSDKDDTRFYKTPPRISRYNIYGLFVANLWGEIITIGVLVAVTLTVFVFQRVNHGFPIINKVLSWLQSLLVWNFLLAFMISNVSDITFYSIIEYQSHYPKTSLSISSLLLAILFFLAVVGILVFAFYKLYQLNKKNNASTSFEEKLKANHKTRVLFEEVKDQFWTQRYFILITSIRALLGATITAAINFPRLQTSLLAAINLAMITYLVVYRPIRTRFGNIELIVYEALVLIANIACFRLSLLDAESQGLAYTTADVIIVVNITYISFMILAQAIGRGKDLWEFYKEFKKQRSSNKVIPTLRIQQQSPRQCPEKDRQGQDDNDKSQAIIENEDEVKLPLTSRGRGFSSPNSDTNAPDNMSSVNEENQKDLENGHVKGRRMMSLGTQGGFTPNSDTNVPDSMSAINEDTREIEVSHQRGLSIGFRGLSVPDTIEGNTVESLSNLNEESHVKEANDEKKKVRLLKFKGSLTLISEPDLPEGTATINNEKIAEMKKERRIKRITLIE